MSHKCLRCGNIFPDNDNSILSGCTDCGSRFFLYMKSVSDAQKIEEIKKDFEKKDTTLEEEITKKIEEEKQKLEEEAKIPEAKPRARERTIKFGIETVKIPKEGVYEINIDALMKKSPLIILEKGKIYLIHLQSAFEEVRKR